MLGLSGASSLSMILSEKRHVGEKLKDSLIHYFGFNQAERSYFEKLIRVNKVTTDNTLSVILLDHFDDQTSKADRGVLARYILAELQKIKGFNLEEISIQLASLLGVTPAELKELAQELPAKPLARQIHLESAELFKRSYDHIEREKRRYYTGMIRVKKECLPQMMEFLRSFERELMARFDDSEGDSLAIVQQALFELPTGL